MQDRLASTHRRQSNKIPKRNSFFFKVNFLPRLLHRWQTNILFLKPRQDSNEEKRVGQML
jgi:hypothetical protein